MKPEMGMRYRYLRDSPLEVEADLDCTVFSDGTHRIVRGSLPGNGMTTGNGITLPEEIGGIDVTELDELWTGGDLDFIVGPALRRAAIDICAKSEAPGHGQGFVRFGHVYARNLQHLRVTCDLPLQIELESDSLTSVMLAAPEIRMSRVVGCPMLEAAYLYGEVLDHRPSPERSPAAESLFDACARLRELGIRSRSSTPLGAKWYTPSSPGAVAGRIRHPISPIEQGTQC